MGFAYVLNVCSKIRAFSSRITSRTRPCKSLGESDTSAKKPAPRPHRKPAGRKREPFDIENAKRLRALGWSNRKIARHTNVSEATIRTKFRQCWAPMRDNPGCTVPPEPAQQAVAAPKPPILPDALLRSPVPPASTPARSTPAPPAPYGLDTIPTGTTTFFLCRGESNAAQARSYGLAAIGIEEWHSVYASLPAFQAAERILVVVTRGEDNCRFIMSIAQDVQIREKCVISAGDASGFGEYKTTWVHAVCKRRHREPPWSTDPAFRRAAMERFEAANGFQPMPLPGSIDKIAELAAPSKTETSQGHDWFAPHRDEWMWRNGTGVR